MDGKTIAMTTVNLVILGAVVYFGAKIIDRVSGKVAI